MCTLIFIENPILKPFPESAIIDIKQTLTSNRYKIVRFELYSKWNVMPLIRLEVFFFFAALYCSRLGFNALLARAYMVGSRGASQLGGSLVGIPLG